MTPVKDGPPAYLSEYGPALFGRRAKPELDRAYRGMGTCPQPVDVRPPLRARRHDAVDKYWNADQQDEEEKIGLHQPVKPIRRRILLVMSIGL